jgi:hypothetical protein
LGKQRGFQVLGFTPDELVEFQKEVDRDSEFEILDVLVFPYVSEKEGTYNTKVKRYSTIRSFFKHNRVSLPRDAGFTIRADREKNQGTLTVEDIRNLVLSSNPMYQAIFLSMFQGSMDRDSFEYWNKNGLFSLSEQLDNDSRVIRVDLPGRKRLKNKMPFYTLIGKDAIEAIRRYLGEYPSRDRSGIFLDKFNNPVSKKAVYQYWMRHLRKIGIVGPSKGIVRSYQTGKNPHELRDVFRSQWEKSPAKGSVAEYLMGHVVDPHEYNKAHRDENWTRKEYLKALPMLNIMSSTKPYGQVKEERLEEQEKELQNLRAEVEKLRNEKLQAGNITSHLEELVTDLIARVEKLEEH